MSRFTALGFAFCLVISIATSGAYYSNKSNNEETNSSPWLGSYYCDDALIKEYGHKLELLTAGSENLKLKLEAYSLKLHHELATQKSSLLDEFKRLFDLLQSSAASARATAAEIPIVPVPVPPTPVPPPIDVRADIDANDNAGGRALTMDLPDTCGDALRAGQPSGVYQINLPISGLQPFYVYCLQDPNNGTAWTIIQRRQEPGTENFYRDWDEYKRGFGNLHGEFFLGLEHLHALTNARLNELWIQMEDFESTTRAARYENFAITDEKSAYALNVLGKYSGDAGNSLAGHEGRKFTTKDADHDTWPKNCAVEFTGAWWYHACHMSNLNGQYLRGEYGQDKFAKGINWKTWKGHHYSLKYVHMAIRPVVRN